MRDEDILEGKLEGDQRRAGSALRTQSFRAYASAAGVNKIMEGRQ